MYVLTTRSTPEDLHGPYYYRVWRDEDGRHISCRAACAGSALPAPQPAAGCAAFLAVLRVGEHEVRLPVRAPTQEARLICDGPSVC